MCITWLLTISGCGACWNLASSGRRLSPFMPCTPHPVEFLLCFCEAGLQLAEMLKCKAATNLGECLLWCCLGDVAHPNLRHGQCNTGAGQQQRLSSICWSRQLQPEPSPLTLAGFVEADITSLPAVQNDVSVCKVPSEKLCPWQKRH
eukprot:GHRQ01011230.1.p1 GENE.GHRQ01011230.1~~GHRQ01011230.1.p1  ORF type:complete len:147 (+),score=16.75 GHRQ01011230.1:430-870(+)